jgi:hypothetical protein
MAKVLKMGPVPHQSEGYIQVPGHPVHVDMQSGEMRVWYLRDEEFAEPDPPIRLAFAATGEELMGMHIKTVMDGAFVWHVIELVDEFYEN